MSINKILLVFLLTVIFSCKNSSVSYSKELVKSLSNTNLLLVELIESNNNSQINIELIDLFRSISEINIENVNGNLVSLFEKYIDNVITIDEKYFNTNFTDSGSIDKLKVIKKFSTLSKQNQIHQLNIELNRFLEHIIRKLNFNSIQFNNQVFLTLIPEKFKVKPNEKFKADVILANKIISQKGKLTLNDYSSRLRMKNGVYHFEEVNNSKSNYSERELEFKFETNINGRDTVLKISHTYIIEK